MGRLVDNVAGDDENKVDHHTTVHIAAAWSVQQATQLPYLFHCTRDDWWVKPTSEVSRLGDHKGLSEPCLIWGEEAVERCEDKDVVIEGEAKWER